MGSINRGQEGLGYLYKTRFQWRHFALGPLHRHINLISGVHYKAPIDRPTLLDILPDANRHACNQRHHVSDGNVVDR
jgi:hypothetical protein